MCMFPACCFRQRTYVAQGILSSSHIDNPIKKALLFLWTYNNYIYIYIYILVFVYWYIKLCRLLHAAPIFIERGKKTFQSYLYDRFFCIC